MQSVFAVLRRKRASVASGATLTVAALTVSTLAVLHQGVPTADLELDDGGVWVTKSSDLLVGHLNYPSRLLDGALRTRTPDFDVIQDGDRVAVVDAANATLTMVDPAAVALGDDIALPGDAQVGLGESTLGVLAKGGVFALAADAPAASTFDADAALLDVGEGAAIAVSRSGSHIVAASVRDKTVTTLATGGGESASVDIADLADDAELSATAVGERGVALDATNGVLYLPSGASVTLPDGEGARLQQAAGDTDAVYIATKTALLRQSLGGGSPEEVAAVPSGIPSAPVWLDGCTYAVWSGTGTYVRDCPGTQDDVQRTIETTPDASLVLRTNRRVVVVNDTLAGTVWVVDQDVQRIENWDEVVPPADDTAEEEQSQDEKPQFDLPERSAQNTPPTAVDDDYGVRAGRSTILRVTENDSDPDGDLLSASLAGEASSGWDVQPVLGGAALQVAVPANATGASSLRYRIDDGRGGTDEATATVTVRPPDVNAPPVQKRTDTLMVEANAAVTYGVLDAWSDPDGDDVFLQQASVEGGDLVTFRSNGVVEYTAASGQTGLREVALVVSDGRESTEGVLRVDVRPADSLNPVANADRVTAVAGVPVTVAPLDNDLSPTGQPLRLAKHDTVPGATIVPDFAGGTFDFVAEQAGTYYVQYLVTDGPRSAVGIVRIDVLVAGDSARPPVTVRDLALLPAGRDVLVDVLANDDDPAGGILVVQNARVAPGSGISVEVLEHRILRITDVSGLSGNVTLTYTVSNGTQSAIGEVLVQSVPLPEQIRPPVTVDDGATVRVGDVVTIPVLANDYHPDNDVMHVAPELVETDAADPSAIFVDGDNVRFQAGNEPGTVHATYEVVDSQQNRTAGYVTIQVLPADQGTNSAPRPKPVTARVVAGNTVRIAVPLDGIDPDGDSVELVGVASNPGKGTVITGDTWFVYEAYPDATGRDSFTYTVRDRLGAEAESTIVVGVATPGFDNQAPYAVKDTVTVKPGRRVAVPVTANDSDPDGDAISIDPDGLTVPEGMDAEVLGGRVVFTAPAEAGEYPLTYTINDSYGASAQGALLVTVSADAPPRPPIARDDRVPPGAVTSSPTVDIAVLENDEDPDGTTDDLTVRTDDPAAQVGAGGILTITLQDAAHIVRYSVEDADGLSAQAFVFVPGLATLVPTLATTDPIVVTSGESVRIDLTERVHVRPEREPRVATADSVRAGHADGSPLLIDERTLEYRSAPGYFGRDSIGVLVTDGTGPDDAEGLSGYVSIPIRVLPAENQSPVMRNASVRVAPGEGSTTLDLARLTRDPDEGDEDRLTFSIDGDVPTGFRASVSGSTLEVGADASVAPGTTSSVRILVSDGVSAPGTGNVTLTAVVSERAFPVANDDTVANAAQGATVAVDVLANDINPFADQGPLTVVSARVDGGSGTARVAGDRVEVTPAGDFVGTMIVGYRIADATNAPERQAEARILLTVQGRPGAPGTPTVTSIQDRTVVLSWSTPTNNGSPITGYTVTSPQGYSRECASTTCTLDGLTNDVEYTFTVVAANAVGDSDPSPASAPARPDARPDTPSSPTAVFGDRSLALTWAAPRSTGSPVTSYTLEISPAPASGPIQRTGVSGTSMVWEGLQNGVAYQVRVQAVNRAPEPSEWSPYSAAVVPAGVPDAPGVPSASFAPSVGAQAQISVSWAAPVDTNGDPITDYTVTSSGGDGQARSQTVTGTSANFSVGTSTSDYSFAVTARNKAGSSVSSGSSTPVRAANAPDAPAAVSIEATGTEGQLRVRITPGPLNGNSPEDVEWLWSGRGGGAVAVESSSASSVVGLISGAANGEVQSVAVRGRSALTGRDGGSTTSNEAKPWGPLRSYTPSVRNNGDRVCFDWNIGDALNGQSLSSLSYGADGGDSGQGGVTGSACSGAGYYAQRNFSMTVSTAEGNSATWTASGNTGANPNRSITVAKGGRANSDSCDSSACHSIDYRISGFAPNTSYTITTYTDCAGPYQAQCGSPGGGAITGGAFQVTTDGSGAASGSGRPFGYPGANVWAIAWDRESNRVLW